MRRALATPGTPLSGSVSSLGSAMVGRLWDFSGLRVHVDDAAHDAAARLSARAFTIGKDVFFRRGEYRPAEPAGLRLLRHELAHVIQSGSATPSDGWRLPLSSPTDASEVEADEAGNEEPRSLVGASGKTPAIRRVLAAYSAPQSEILRALTLEGPSGGVLSMRSTADAARLRIALAALIASKKVEVASVGDREFFSLPATGSATLTEVGAALKAAGFARALFMAGVVVDRHNAYLFSGEEVYEMQSFWTFEVGRERDVLRQTDRPLTSEELAEARLAFGPGLNYGSIRITEDPVLGVGDIARTLPSTIFFPPGASTHPGFIPWLIHELTHSWQYQHGVGLVRTGGTAFLCWAGVKTYDYGGQPGLLAAAARGQGFSSFNTEQQGDIVRDYYRALKSRLTTSAWSPFLPEIQSPP